MTGIGGIQQYIRTLKKALEELGHEVKVLSRNHFPKYMFSSMYDKVIITHRHYLPFIFAAPFTTEIILLLHGIDAEPELTWLEQVALTRVSTIWVISEWTKGLAKKFGKPTEILYLCAS